MTRKWDKRLAWWLDLANLYKSPPADHVAEGLEGEALMRYLGSRPYKEHEAPPCFAARLRRLRQSKHRPLGLDQLLIRSPLGADKCAYSLAQTTNAVLHRLVSLPDLPVELRDVPALAHTEAASGALYMDVLNGRVGLVRLDPLTSLCSLLNNKPTHLIGRCPVCGRLFERLRKDQKCDTPRCRDTHRKREWRKHEDRYEETRRINRRVRSGMPLGRAKAEMQTKRRKRRGVR
jgi:hypothetical protein